MAAFLFRSGARPSWSVVQYFAARPPVAVAPARYAQLCALARVDPESCSADDVGRLLAFALPQGEPPQAPPLVSPSAGVVGAAEPVSAAAVMGKDHGMYIDRLLF